MQSKKSIVATLLYSVQILICLSIGIIGYFWIMDSLVSFNDESKELIRRSTEMRKAQVKSQIEQTITYIQYKKEQTEQRLRINVKARVLEAYNLTEYLYETNKNDLPKNKILRQIHDALTPIRWNQNDRGYYFIIGVDELMYLNANQPSLEGQSCANLRDGNGRRLAKEIIDIALNSKDHQGYLTYLWFKPTDKEKIHPKITFVKYFQPLDIIIASGEYLDDIKTDIQTEILDRLAAIRFLKNGYIFVIDFDGTVLVQGNDKRLINSNVMHLQDQKGTPFIEQLIATSQEKDGGFVQYYWRKPDQEIPVEKITYARSIPTWDWCVGGGLYLDELEEFIAEKKSDLTKDIQQQLIKIAIILLSSLVASSITVRIISRKIRASLSIFNTFFHNATHNSARIDESKINILELQQLAVDANTMIADLKQVELDLIITKEHAEQASKAKSTFLANMSHEIRTPMNGINGMINLVMETTLSNKQRDYLTMATNSSERLLSVIDDILDFSKIEAEKLTLYKEPFALREIVCSTTSLLAASAYKKNLELLVDVADDVPENLIGDAGRLRQILLNLIGNAIKFTPRGEITITVNLSALHRVDKSVHLNFTVTDTGIGISQDKQRQIFEAFDQEDTSVGRRFGGTGLGLAISMALVKLMDGILSVHAEKNRGSTFHFSIDLPTADPQPLFMEKQLFPDTRFFLFEQHKAARKSLESKLKTLSSLVTVSNSVLELELVIRESKADIILLNPYHHEMTKENLCRLIRFMEEKKIMAFLTCKTGHLHAASEEELTINEIHKPICLLTLINQIKTIQQTGSLKAPFSIVNSVEMPLLMQKLSLLLVEDEFINQEVAKNFLQSDKWDLVITNNGQEALEELAKSSFDLVFMDLQMPRMDGLTATKTIRRQEQGSNSHLPIIAMTAHAMKGDREECLASGFDGYVSKPVVKQDLYGEIARVMGEQSPIPTQMQMVENKDDTQPVSLNTLLQNCGGEQVAKELLDHLFNVSWPGWYDELKPAISNGDVQTIRKVCHAMAGTLGNMGIGPLTDATQELGALARAEDITALVGAMMKMEHFYKELYQWAYENKFLEPDTNE